MFRDRYILNKSLIGMRYGLYFYKNEASHNGTIKDERYRFEINDFFVPELKDVDLNQLWLRKVDYIRRKARDV